MPSIKPPPPQEGSGNFFYRFLPLFGRHLDTIGENLTKAKKGNTTYKFYGLHSPATDVVAHPHGKCDNTVGRSLLRGVNDPERVDQRGPKSERVES